MVLVLFGGRPASALPTVQNEAIYDPAVIVSFDVYGKLLVFSVNCLWIFGNSIVARIKSPTLFLSFCEV